MFWVLGCPVTDCRFLSLCLIGFLLFSSSIARSQTPARFLVWATSPIGSNNEHAAPGLKLSRQITEVEIVEFLVEGKEINIGEAFSASDDFLRMMSFKVKNSSDRQMSRIQLTLIVPDEKHHSPQIIYCYGCNKEQGEKGIAPGKVVELTMPRGGLYDFVKTNLAEKGVTVVQKVEISHMYVHFPDGPVLFSGCIKTTNRRNACL
jgi:hypothetical protein